MSLVKGFWIRHTPPERPTRINAPKSQDMQILQSLAKKQGSVSGSLLAGCGYKKSSADYIPEGQETRAARGVAGLATRDTSCKCFKIHLQSA